MKKLLELRQQKADLITQSKSILETSESEQRTVNPKESELLADLRKRIEGINTHIEHAQTVSDHERSLIGATSNQEQSNKPSNSELRAFVQSGDHRSLSVGVNADGGYTVIPSVDSTIQKLLRDGSVFRQNATVKSINTETYKKMVSVGGTTTEWAAESDTRGESNTSKLEEVSIKLNSLYAYPMTTQELLDWSDFDVSGWLSSEVAAETLIKEEAAFWNGNAVKKPKGLLTYTRSTAADSARTFGEIQEFTSAALGVIDFDDLITFYHGVAMAYRPNSKFYMSDSMAMKLRKIKNTQDEYVWRDSVVDGQPTTLLGKPVIISDQVPADEILFGDLTLAYHVIDHTSGTRMIRDNVTKPGFVKMLTTRYVGGGLIDSNAIKVLKEAA
jgi:HK97 family phage major capsid protein